MKENLYNELKKLFFLHLFVEYERETILEVIKIMMNHCFRSVGAKFELYPILLLIGYFKEMSGYFFLAIYEPSLRAHFLLILAIMAISMDVFALEDLSARPSTISCSYYRECSISTSS